MFEYEITEEQKKQFASTYLLNYMINTPKTFPVFLEGNSEDLEPVLEYLMQQKCIEIKDKKQYIPTKKGREVLVQFRKRYQDFLKNFDIFCAVDLEEGVFAFEDYLDYIEKPQQWEIYLQEERWEDLRVAVAKLKGLNPVEIVFMSFLNEGRYGKTESGWEFDLLLGSIWDEIAEICENALKIDDLAFEDEEGFVSGEDVLQDIMAQAAELNIELAKEAEEMDTKALAEEIEYYEDEPDDDYYVEEVIVEDVSYDTYYGYRDPFYVSPIWLILLF